MFLLCMESMAVAFYFLKVRGDLDTALEKIKQLNNVEYAVGIFGKYDVIVKVSGNYPKDMVDFWREASEIGGVRITDKCLSPKLD